MSDTTPKRSAKAKAPKRPGRPTQYTDDVALRICEALANGKSLLSICMSSGMPKVRTIFGWLETHAEFARNYVRARNIRAEVVASELIELSDKAQGKDADAIQALKLRIDTRKWVAARQLPKRYGDHVTHEVSDGLLRDTDAPTSTAVDWSRKIELGRRIAFSLELGAIAIEEERRASRSPLPATIDMTPGGEADG